MSNGKPIESLTIEGFKSIRKMKNLRFDNLNVLIGSNGSGKSNLISFFKMLNAMVNGNFQLWVRKQGGVDRILSFGVKETNFLTSSISFALNHYEFQLVPTADDSFSFDDEKLYFSGWDFPAQTIFLGSGQMESQIKNHTKNGETIKNFCYDSISKWTVYHFHDTGEKSGMKRLCSVHDNEIFRSDASNLAAFLFKLLNRFPDVYDQIRKTVRLAIPFFDDFVLKPQVLNTDTEEEQIRLLWRQQGSNYNLWSSQLSDGSLRFICLVTALLQPEPPSTIVIDEPELGLHPYAITLLGSLLRSAAKRMQVIVSTQSVPLVNEFSIHNLIVVERVNEESVFRRVDEDEFQDWLQEYSVGELWEKNILGGRPK
jgi:predicted ATPase